MEGKNTHIILKVCGTKNLQNAKGIATCMPDMMGFILYPKSKRYLTISQAEDIIAELPKSIAKVAVLVNEPLQEALAIASTQLFDYIQLHGNESALYCKEVATIKPVIKAFGVGNVLPSELESYQAYCTYFLFDTQTDQYGGSGKRFDHNLLNDYHLELPFIISGGIDENNVSEILAANHPRLAGVDVNSKFEVEAGIKDIERIKELQKRIYQCTKR